MSESTDAAIRAGLEELQKDLRMLLDNELTFGSPVLSWKETDSPDSGLPLEIDLSILGEADGRIRVRMERDLGIVMGGLLTMVDAAVIQDRLASEGLAEADADAIAEIGSQIAGSLRSGIGKMRGDTGFSVKRGDVWLAGQPGPVLDAGSMLEVRVSVDVVDHPGGKVSFTFDRSGAATALGAVPPAKEEPEESTPVTTRSPAAHLADDPDRPDSSLLLLYDTRESGWSTADVIRSTTGWPIVIQRTDGTERRRILEGGIAVVVIDTGERKERGVTACRRLVRLIGDAELPVFLCAPAWRRDEVQRAIRAGVSGILVKPLDPDRVREALGEFAAVV